MNAYQHEFKETLLSVSHVSKTLGEKLVLRDVDLQIRDVVRPDVKQGQVVGLLGPSGVGKTTLFRILAGLDEPDSGQVLIGEKQQPVRRGSVGVVAQNYPLFAHRTVLSNLVVAGKQAGLNGSEAKTKALDLLRRFEIEETAPKYTTQISGGQRQRVAIAQQFMCSEGFLLMDEPFSGLDLLAQGRVIRFVREMAQLDELNSFIIVTHDISAAIEVCDTLWILGRERDDKGNAIAGARVIEIYDLMERGLAWHDNVTAIPEYMTLRQEIRELFPRL